MLPRTAPTSALVLVLLALASTGCSGADRDDTTATPKVTVSKEFCSRLDTDDLPDDLASVSPASHRAAIEAVLSMDRAMSSDAGPDSKAIAALARDLGADGVDRHLAGLAASARQECGPSDGATTLANLALTAQMAGAPKDDDYCAALVKAFEPGRESEPQLADVEKIAPAEHVEGLRAFEAAVDGQDRPDPGVAVRAGMAAFGLGLYAEATCGIDDGFVTMALAGSFMGAAGSGEAAGKAGGGDVAASAEPPDADPAAADAAVPAGTALAFEARTVALEDDDTYRASILVPVGWDEGTGLGTSFGPSRDSDLSIFTEITFDTGCDGMCEPNDWAKRLRGPDGYLTGAVADRMVSADRTVQGSDGAVVTISDKDGVAAIVLRWDDERSKYFRCEVRLDAEQAAWLDAFVAACEGSRPGWISVS